MGSSFTVESLNDVFKETYASAVANMLPGGIRFQEWDYWSMTIDRLAKHVEHNKEAAAVYAQRSSKLGKYLEGK